MLTRNRIVCVCGTGTIVIITCILCRFFSFFFFRSSNGISMCLVSSVYNSTHVYIMFTQPLDEWHRLCTNYILRTMKDADKNPRRGGAKKTIASQYPRQTKPNNRKFDSNELYLHFSVVLCLNACEWLGVCVSVFRAPFWPSKIE